MKIEPAYVIFEQSKLLKEKGFNIEVDSFYENTGPMSGNILYKNCGENNYNNYDFKFHEDSICYSRPEQWQVVEWFFHIHKIYIHTTILGDDDTFIDENSNWSISIWKNKMYNLIWGSKVTPNIDYFKSKQEAYSAAFNYILTII